MTNINQKCPLCNVTDAKPIDVARKYIGDQEPPVICQGCGFVYVQNRRSSAEIAKSWDDLWGEGYSSKWPMVQARLTYVVEWFEQEVTYWNRKDVLDVGAGEGDFAIMLRGRDANVTPLDPCAANVISMSKRSFYQATLGTIQSYAEQTSKTGQKFDVVTILWTLENSGDCVEMLRLAGDLLKPNGHVVVATGSRILVPYKKPMSHYFSKNPQDLHAWRFSRNTLATAMSKAGLKTVAENRWQDGDWLVMAGQKRDDGLFYHDDPAKVMAFFEGWAKAFP
jgi:2-polyprenyl-3-methyl-5-hydroxy-6-metoxy-1,4-benzoquinol methylase